MGATGKDVLVDDGGFDSDGYYHGPPSLETDRSINRKMEAELCELALNLFRLAKAIKPGSAGYLVVDIERRAIKLTQECVGLGEKEGD